MSGTLTAPQETSFFYTMRGSDILPPVDIHIPDSSQYITLWNPLVDTAYPRWFYHGEVSLTLQDMIDRAPSQDSNIWLYVPRFGAIAPIVDVSE